VRRLAQRFALRRTNSRNAALNDKSGHDVSSLLCTQIVAICVRTLQ
jgi:hypothetical protein